MEIKIEKETRIIEIGEILNDLKSERAEIEDEIRNYQSERKQLIKEVGW